MTGPGASWHRCRLANGQLRELVLAHLRAYPRLDFSPVELANVLDRQNSRNAIARICRRLVDEGLACRAQEAPQRFRAIPPAQAPPA